MKNENFRKLISNTPSKWEEKVNEKIEKPWLSEYSAKIARNISAILNTRDEFNQTDLAVLLGVERQYISRVLQGKENLSLQTIWKLSRKLEFELLDFPTYNFNVNEKLKYKEFRQSKENKNLEAMVIPFSPFKEQPDSTKVIYSYLKLKYAD
ncbi:MAG TPA: helix-turn-helix transcriptional regulator [Puia sp.]|nr:helix-turn-helix transcriptional regulator [Puia sp.]